MGREEIGEMLENKGFYRKETRDAEVPEEYKEGPYIPKTQDGGDNKAKSEL